MGAVLVCPAQTLPASCPRFSKHAGKGSKPHKRLLQNVGRATAILPDGNSDFPRNPPGKLMAAVPRVPASACLSSSALGDSRVAGMPLPGLAPNLFSQEQREEVLEGALKIRGEGEAPPPQKKTPQAMPTILL